MRPILLLLPAALIAGCADRPEAPVPPSSYDGKGPPLLPSGGAVAEGAEDHAGCDVQIARAFPRFGGSFHLPVNATFAAEHARAWENATASVRIAGDRVVEFNATPKAADGQLAFTLENADLTFAAIDEPGRFVPWSIALDIASDDPEIADLSLDRESALTGWLLVTRGADEVLWAYLEGRLLRDDPFARADVFGGTIFVIGGGPCA